MSEFTKTQLSDVAEAIVAEFKSFSAGYMIDPEEYQGKKPYWIDSSEFARILASRVVDKVGGVVKEMRTKRKKMRIKEEVKYGIGSIRKPGCFDGGFFNSERAALKVIGLKDQCIFRIFGPPCPYEEPVWFWDEKKAVWSNVQKALGCIKCGRSTEQRCTVSECGVAVCECCAIYNNRGGKPLCPACNEWLN